MTDRRPCPYCAEEIAAQAVRCPHCRSRLVTFDATALHRDHPERKLAGVAAALAQALAVGGRVQRHREHDASLRDEARDQRRQAYGRHGDPARRDGVAPFGGEDLEGRDHGVVVRERLAHAHQHDVGEASGNGERLAGAYLADDLGGPQVPDQAHSGRGAEAAAHAAAGLARDAQGEPVARATRTFDLRDEDALDRRRAPADLGVGREMEQQLARAVRSLRDDRRIEATDRERRCQPRAQRLGQVLHVVEPGNGLAVDPGEDLPRPVRRLTGVDAPRLELGRRQVLDITRRHGRILASRKAKRQFAPADEPVERRLRTTAVEKEVA